jgi:hypothetical protein
MGLAMQFVGDAPSGNSLREAKIRKLEIGAVHNYLEKRCA